MDPPVAASRMRARKRYLPAFHGSNVSLRIVTPLRHVLHADPGRLICTS